MMTPYRGSLARCCAASWGTCGAPRGAQPACAAAAGAGRAQPGRAGHGGRGVTGTGPRGLRDALRMGPQ